MRSSLKRLGKIPDHRSHQNEGERKMQVSYSKDYRGIPKVERAPSSITVVLDCTVHQEIEEGVDDNNFIVHCLALDVQACDKTLEKALAKLNSLVKSDLDWRQQQTLKDIKTAIKDLNNE